jgi:predicted transcriptional regulator
MGDHWFDERNTAVSVHRQAPGIPQFSSIEELQRWIATADGSVITELFESLRPTDPARLEEMARVVDEALDLARDQASAPSPDGVTAEAAGSSAR